MPVYRRPVLPALALALFACGPAAQPPTGTAVTPTATTPPHASGEHSPRTSEWVDAGGGLSLKLELPAGPLRVGDSLTLRLHFRNDGAAPMRIYIIGSEPFRAMQSSLYVLAADGSVLAFQPEPRPHGYVVSETDFPEIAAGATKVVEQTLSLDPRVLAGKSGLRVRWSYANDIERWQGGLQTLDGPTRGLFGGGPIPGIWRGEARVELPLPVAP